MVELGCKAGDSAENHHTSKACLQTHTQAHNRSKIQEASKQEDEKQNSKSKCFQTLKAPGASELPQIPWYKSWDIMRCDHYIVR